MFVCVGCCLLDFTTAIECYSSALQSYPKSCDPERGSCDHERAVCYANRGACYMKKVRVLGQEVGVAVVKRSVYVWVV